MNVYFCRIVDWKGSYCCLDILGLKFVTFVWLNDSSGLGNKQGDNYGCLFLTEIDSRYALFYNGIKSIVSDPFYFGVSLVSKEFS